MLHFYVAKSNYTVPMSIIETTCGYNKKYLTLPLIMLKNATLNSRRPSCR